MKTWSLFSELIVVSYCSSHLYDTDLSVGHADEPAVDQLVPLGVTRLSLHDLALRLLIGQGDCRHLHMQSCYEAFPSPLHRTMQA